MYNPRQRSSPEALFRFLALSRIYSFEQQGYSRAEAVRKVLSEALYDFKGCRRAVSERTLYRWLKLASNIPSKTEAVENSGITLLEALEPAKRQQIEGSKVLSKQFLDYCKREKELDERASVPELIKRARLDGLDGADKAQRSTVYRALKRQGVCLQRRRKSGPTRDCRRFSFPHRMQCILCDGKHFRAGPTRAKRVVLIFLDDSSRYVLDAFVSTSENRWIFLRGLYEVCLQYGLMDRVYLDRGPGFVASETIEIIGNFSHLIQGERAYPQGHGKIEKFNQTLLKDLLRSLDENPTVDPDCEHLRLMILHYIRTDYNVSVHESLDGRTPRECFLNDERELIFPENETIFRQKFVIDFKRRVSRDNVVKVHAMELEVPTGYAGSLIALRERMFDKSVHFLHKGKLIELQEVNKTENARSLRARKKKTEKKSPNFVRTAAHRRCDRDLAPIVGPDGGYPESEN